MVQSGTLDLLIEIDFQYRSMLTDTCTRRTLATGDCMVVEQCSCGSVHLTIGAVTLRLARSAIPSIAATLTDAARTLVLREACAFTTTTNEALS